MTKLSLRLDGRLIYSPAAKFFHWLTVLLIAAQITLGWTMPGAHRGMPPTLLNDLHMTIGFTLLAVIVLRFAWRSAYGVPEFEAGTPLWQARAANAMHLSLYVLVLVFIMTGWANATFHKWPIRILWVIPVPPLFPQLALVRTIGHLHNILVWVLLALVAGHITAALWHHVVMRDRTLRRMLPVSLGGS